VSETVLQITGLVRHFGDVHAVQDVSFSVDRGQVLGFIGPNGAGKTTTMRILATLTRPAGTRASDRFRR
jgi:ABC-2 type transport system ATP-binding protein